MSKRGDDNDYLRQKGSPAKLQVKQRYDFIWPPSFPAIGSFNDLENDDSELILEVGKSCFSGLRVTMINKLERDYKFRVNHAFEYGRKEERLMNGQKDGRRAQYTLGTLLTYNNFNIQLSKTAHRRGDISINYNNGKKFNSSFNVEMTPLKTDADLSVNFAAGSDMNIEAKFANYNKSDKYPKTKISKPEPTMSIGFTQPATERVAFGTQISFVPYTDKAQLKVICRHLDVPSNSKATLAWTSGTMSDPQIKAAYSQEVTKNVTVVASTELKFSPLVGRLNDYEWKSVSKLGYSLDGAGVSVYGSVDTDSAVNMVMNTYIGPDFVITLSANCNYYKRKYDAGFGIQFPI
jgi:hypothetical protein